MLTKDDAITVQQNRSTLKALVRAEGLDTVVESRPPSSAELAAARDAELKEA